MAGRVKTDALFLALTRPALVMGVSFMFFMFNMFGWVMYFGATSDFKAVLFAAGVHFIGMYLTKKEPLMVEMVLMKMQKFNGGPNKSFYKGLNSYNLF